MAFYNEPPMYRVKSVSNQRPTFYTYKEPYPATERGPNAATLPEPMDKWPKSYRPNVNKYKPQGFHPPGRIMPTWNAGYYGAGVSLTSYDMANYI